MLFRSSRFVTYGVELAGAARNYQERLLDADGVREWCDGARTEPEFVAADEPYAEPPG